MKSRHLFYHRQVSLDEYAKNQIEIAAEEQGISISEVIRIAIEEYIRNRRKRNNENII